MLAYFVLRSAMLMTVEAPEARYTLECFPMLFALGGVTAGWAFKRIAGLGLCYPTLATEKSRKGGAPSIGGSEEKKLYRLTCTVCLLVLRVKASVGRA
jgi:hypothetical protein